MRVYAIIAYDGSRFFGSQHQKKTKQTVLGRIYALFAHLGIDTKIHAAGRTDAGVHARGQVLSFDLPEFWSDLVKLRTIINTNLKQEGIECKKLGCAPQGFHARFDAHSRSYLYLIKPGANVFESRFMADYNDFDPARLAQGVKLFEGRHDFTGFCKSGSNTATGVRTLHRARMLRYKGICICYFQAEGFLRSQVRLMVGAAMAYAQDQIDFDKLQQQLRGDKRWHRIPAQPQGLYLSRIGY